MEDYVWMIISAASICASWLIGQIFYTFDVIASLLYFSIVPIPVIFGIFLIVKYDTIPTKLYDFFYKTIKGKIESLYEPESNMKTDLAGVILVSIIISFPSVYFLASSPIGFFSSFIPGIGNSDSFQQIAGKLPEKGVFDFISRDEIYLTLSLITFVGIFWVFVLRQIRFREILHGSSKHQGSRIFLAYFYFTIAFFAIQESSGGAFFGKHGPFVGLSLNETINSLMILVGFYALITTIVAYFFEKLLLPKSYVFPKSIDRKKERQKKKHQKQLTKFKKF